MRVYSHKDTPKAQVPVGCLWVDPTGRVWYRKKGNWLEVTDYGALKRVQLRLTTEYGIF